MNLHVTKGNGEKVLFDAGKLKQALQSSGAGKQEQESIVRLVRDELYDGIPTRKIYQLAFSLLKKESYKMAGRYRLKNAIMELGPTGFPFEKFVGRVLETMGYQVETGVIVKGKCVQHEVDVVARKNGEMLMIECKFHSDSLTKSGVQVPLYIHSRFLDVKAAWEKQYGTDLQYHGGVVTNTRFSEDAMSYGTCVGLFMVSWDFPQGEGLKQYIDKSGLHPLTSLISLSKAQKQQLLEKGIVLCSEITNQPDLLREMGLPEKQINRILREARNLIAK
ncbi:restriction endonuclease [Maribellus sp. CM-23]|uniref:restriction endonuclease n=1 Tax=Maribellus sp. CM-23 TaxID=2781026 RepID=UPI001F3EF703|nr:restriction endonuclease [Maribellus sp. CM-23]MCE4566325.1 restriction endonuclease [Maribellus sp. CM-23]